MEQLVRVTRGVWRPESLLTTLAGRVAAILAGCPERTVVCGVTAAQLHGLWLPPWLADDHHRPVDVVVHRAVHELERRPGSTRPEVRARRQHLRSDEVVVLDGIPLTSEARTWLDLAALLLPADLLALGDSALRGAATAGEMVQLVGRARHRRGVVRARHLLPLLDARSRSRPESHLRYALHTHGMPAPGVNVAIHSAVGEWLAEPDLSYDDVRLAIEYNGAEHALVPRMRKDITREIDVEMRGGWRMITFGPAEVFDRPDQVAARVAALRRERCHLSVTGDLDDDWRAEPRQ